MPDLPAMLRVTGRRCLIVGGGEVALRRAAALRQAGAEVVVVAPRVDPRLAAAGDGQTIHVRPFAPADLRGVWLVVVATDDPAINRRVAEQARASGVLVNRADAGEEGDLTVPAHARQGPITIAVHTDGVSAAAAAGICRQLAAALDPDWPRLLEAAAPYRARIQAAFPDHAERRRRLLALTDATALATLRRDGRAALERRLQDLLDPGAPVPEPSPDG